MPAHALYFSTYELARVKLAINDEHSHPYLFALTGATAAFLHDSIMTPVDSKMEKWNSAFFEEDLKSFLVDFSLFLLQNSAEAKEIDK